YIDFLKSLRLSIFLNVNRYLSLPNLHNPPNDMARASAFDMAYGKREPLQGAVIVNSENSDVITDH
ncbi:MAG: hypothetical protein KDD42_04010, partial [Bdellovibrionales bacterium]|nr:hypothetical protein [Bdellovibrionales bacterium]